MRGGEHLDAARIRQVARADGRWCIAASFRRRSQESAELWASDDECPLLAALRSRGRPEPNHARLAAAVTDQDVL